MTVQGNEIGFFYSGGINNSDPNSSIGGEISINPISSPNLNNLFDNVDADGSSNGLTDYRCVYINNTNSSDTLYNPSIYINLQITNGSNVLLGIRKKTDTQLINIDLNLFNTFTLTYDYETTDSIIYDANIVSNIETALNNLTSLSGVVVSDLGNAIYQITFEGDDDEKYHPLLISNSIDVTIEKSINGGPINYTASNIGVDTVEPYEVEFLTTNSTNVISLKNIKSGDYFPFWIKRITEAGTSALDLDRVSIIINGYATK